MNYEKQVNDLISELNQYHQQRSSSFFARIWYGLKDKIYTNPKYPTTVSARLATAQEIATKLEKSIGDTDKYCKGLSAICHNIEKIPNFYGKKRIAPRSYSLSSYKYSNLETSLITAKNILATSPYKESAEVKDKVANILITHSNTLIANSLADYAKQRSSFLGSLKYVVRDWLFKGGIHSKAKRIQQATRYANLIKACHTTKDYVKFLKESTETISAITDNDSELKRLLVVSQRAIVKEIYATGVINATPSEIDELLAAASPIAKRFGEARELVRLGRGRMNVSSKPDSATDEIQHLTHHINAYTQKKKNQKPIKPTSITINVAEYADDAMKNPNNDNSFSSWKNDVIVKNFQKNLVNEFQNRIMAHMVLSSGLVEHVKGIRREIAWSLYYSYFPFLAGVTSLFVPMAGRVLENHEMSEKRARDAAVDDKFSLETLPQMKKKFADKFVKIYRHQIQQLFAHDSDTMATKKVVKDALKNIINNLVAGEVTLVAMDEQKASLEVQHKDEQQLIKDLLEILKHSFDPAYQLCASEIKAILEKVDISYKEVLTVNDHDVSQLFKLGFILPMIETLLSIYPDDTVLKRLVKRAKTITEKCEDIGLDMFADALVRNVHGASRLSGQYINTYQDDFSLIPKSRWNTYGFLTQPGLVVAEPDEPIKLRFFGSRPGQKPEQYGYRFATMDEVKELNLEHTEHALRDSVHDYYINLYEKAFDQELFNQKLRQKKAEVVLNESPKGNNKNLNPKVKMPYASDDSSSIDVSPIVSSAPTKDKKKKTSDEADRALIPKAKNPSTEIPKKENEHTKKAEAAGEKLRERDRLAKLAKEYEELRHNMRSKQVKELLAKKNPVTKKFRA